jgi:hypothetical protein
VEQKKVKESVCIRFMADNFFGKERDMKSVKSFVVVPVMILTLFAGIFSTVKAQDSEEKLDYGTLDGMVYKNAYFGLTVTVPDKWQIQSSEVTRSMQERGKETLAGDDENFKSMLDASEKDSVNLITVFKFPLGAQVTSNPAFLCVAEKISMFPGITKGEDYLYHTRQLLAKSKVKYVFEEKVDHIMIGDVPFDVQSGVISFGNMSITQRFYVTIMKGYALSFVISGTTPAELKELEVIMKKVAFGK